MRSYPRKGLLSVYGYPFIVHGNYMEHSIVCGPVAGVVKKTSYVQAACGVGSVILRRQVYGDYVWFVVAMVALLVIVNNGDIVYSNCSARPRQWLVRPLVAKLLGNLTLERAKHE